MLGGRSPLEDPLGKLDSLSIADKLPPSVEDQLFALRGRIRAAYIDQLWLRVEAVLVACRQWKVRVLLFPEYSIPWELLPRVAEAASDIVVVAGTHMVDPAARRSKVYESLGWPQERAVQLGQAVSPVLHGGRLLALQPKLQASRFEGDNLTLGKAWTPVALPPTISGPMGVLVCIDFLSREAGAHRALVAEKLSECRFLVVPSLTPVSSTVEFAAKAWEEARRYGRPVLYANDAERGGTSIFVDEGQQSDLRDFPSRAGYLEPGDEGVIVADVDLGFERPGPSTRYDHEAPVKAFACAGFVGSWHPTSVQYAAWLDELAPRLEADDDIESAVAVIEKAKETLRAAGAGNSARDRRLTGLLRYIRNAMSAETLRRFTREIRLPAGALPPEVLRAALSNGAAEALFDIYSGAHVPEVAHAEKAMRDAARPVLPRPAGTWTDDAARAAESVATAVRGPRAPEGRPETALPSFPRDFSPVALGDCQAGNFWFSFRSSSSGLFDALFRAGMPPLDITGSERRIWRTAPNLQLFETHFLLSSAEGYETVVLAARERDEDAGVLFLLRRSEETWMLVPFADAVYKAEAVRKALRQHLAFPSQLESSDPDSIPRRMEAVARRFRGDEVIRQERERRLGDVGGNFIEPAVLVNGSTKEQGGLEALDEWLSSASGEPALVLGEFGSGKSTLLLEWAKKQNEDAKRPGGGVFRIAYCNLAGAGAGATALRLVLAACELKETPANRAGAELLIRYEALVPCFDGFDEMATRVAPGELAGRLSELLSVTRGGGRVIVSSRDNYFPSDEALRTAVSEALNTSLFATAYRRIRLQPFDSDRIERLVRAICGSASEAEDALRRIESIYDLRDLVHTPLLLGMVLKTLDTLDPEARVARADVYEACLTRWLKNTPRAGPEGEVFTGEQKETFAEALAEQLWRSGEPSLTWDELTQAVRAKLAASIPDENPFQDAYYEASGGMFFIRDPGGRYRFAHKSFLEFFLARSLVRTLPERPERPAEALTTKPFSPEVAMFFREILQAKGDPKEAKAVLSVREWLRRRRLETDLGKTAEAAANALRLLKALPERAKDGWQWIPEGADLRQIVVPGEDLRGIRLRSARLSEALLSGCDLSDSDLSGADFTGARLVAARLDRANLSGAIAVRADFTRAEGTGCMLNGANLAETDLTASVWLDSPFEGAQLEGAITSGFVAPRAHRVAAVHLDLLPPAVRVAVELGHTGPVDCVAFSPDGSRIASGSRDNTVRLWDAASGKEIRSLSGHSASVSSVAFSPDGTHIASGSADNTVRLWDAATGKEIRSLSGHSASVRSVAFSPDGTRIASGSRDNAVRLWDAATGKKIRSLSGHSASVSSVAFSPNGTRIASGSHDHTVRLWDAASGQEIRSLSGHSDSVYSVAFSRDGTRIASGSHDHTVRLWDAASGQEIRSLSGHSDSVYSVAFSRDGTRIASGSNDHTVRLWDAASGQEIRSLSGHSDSVYSVAFSRDGTRIASGSRDKPVRLWDAATGQEIRSLSGHLDSVYSVAFSPDGTRIACGSGNNIVRLWDAATGKEVRSLWAHSSFVNSVEFSIDGSIVRLWDPATGKEIRSLSGHSSSVNSIAFSPDGTRIACGSRDNTVRLWDAATGKKIRSLSGHSDSVYSVAFSPDGTCIASGSNDHTVRLWDAATGKEIRSLSGHSDSVYSVAFSPDGTCIASGSNGHTVRLWDAATGKEIRSLSGHSSSVNSIAFSPDGTRIASGSRDNTVRLWDAASGKGIRSLSGHSDSVYSVAFSLDGTRIASGSNDQTVRLWDAATGKELACIQLNEPWLVTVPCGAVNLDVSQARRFRLEATSWRKGGSRTTLCLPLPKALLEVFHQPDLVARSIAGEDISPDVLRPELAKLGITGGRPWDGELWRVPESPRVPGPPVVLQADPQPTKEGSVIGDHFRIIETALRRIGYLLSGVPLPEPYQVASGVAGKSAVYFFSLERPGSLVNLVIKLDEPERAAREWKVVQELLKSNTHPSAMLPVHGNGEEDGVIIFKDAGAITTGVRTLQIGELLRQQITSNPGQCVDALDRAWEALDVFYRSEPGAVQSSAKGRPLRWEGAFPRVKSHLSEIALLASHGWPAVKAWLSSISRVLPDPAEGLGGLSQDRTGPLMLSRVHGDLNLQNILINVDGSARPVAALIIDLANSEPSMPTAIDFSRLESELWHEVFVGDKTDAGGDGLLTAFLRVRDCFEGRQTSLQPGEAGTAEQYLRVVAAIRQHAAQLLRGNLSGYLLEDYLTALYFQHMQALSYPTVNQHPLKIRLALLGAATSLQFLEDLHSGRYAEKALNRLASPLRTYAEMAAPPSFVPPSTAQATVSPPAASKYSISIGKAKNVVIGDSDRERS